ncbi:MAG: hypothetical protein ONA90_10345 [candidate division KSB1 bacterium]|nr:hypothetical protein [candidate division KSB1 bacterium]
MHIENQNALLSLFYREATPEEAQTLRRHLIFCEECREYMKHLQQMDSALSRWQDERPLPETFDRIMEKIPAAQPLVIPARPVHSPRPIFNIAFALASILLLIYFVQSKISTLALWQGLEQFWVIQTIGRFGFVALAFFGIGTFIALSLAPILYFDLNKKALSI